MKHEPQTLDMLLFDYAAGTLGAAESFVVATYLSLNPHARQRMAELEDLGGALLHSVAPAEVSGTCLEKTLRAIEACTDETPCTQKLRENNELDLPLPLLALLCDGNGLPALRWKKLAAQAEVIEICACTSQPRQTHLRLLRLAPGSQAPAARAITVVLQGSYVDASGQYRRGDIVITAHPARAADEGCVCLTLTRGENALLRLLGALRLR